MSDGLWCCAAFGWRSEHKPTRFSGGCLTSQERYDRRGATPFLDVPPDLIVEILAPGNSWLDTMQKVREFFSIGVRLVWLVDPLSKSVFAYRSITDVREFTLDDQLPGDDVLPGLSVAVRDIFAE